jgi:polar amino acid transport system substrate-binding protein
VDGAVRFRISNQQFILKENSMRIVFMVWMALFAYCGSALAQQVLKVGFADTNKAYQALLTLIYKEAGLVPEFVELPRERSLRMANAGQIDADIGRVAGVLSAYPNLVETTLVMEMHLLAVVKMGSSPSKLTLADLPQYRIGFLRGTKLAEGLIEALNIRGNPVNTIPQLLKMLASDRIDVALIVSTQSISLYPEQAAGLVTLPDPLRTIGIVHVLNKKWAVLVPKINGAIKVLKADGRMARAIAAAQQSN